MTRHSIVIAIVALVSSGLATGSSATEACGAPAPSSGEWRTFGHDSTNSRHQDAESAIGPLEAATLAPTWTFSVAGAGGAGDITGTPVVAGGCVFVGTNGGSVHAIDVATGEAVWTTEVTDGINSTLAVGDDLVYAHVNRSGSPYVAAFDRHTGTEVWTTTVSTQDGAQLWSSVVLYDGMVFSGVSGGRQGAFALVDAATGDLLLEGNVVPVPAQAEGFAGGSIVATAAVDVETGFAYVGTGSAPDSWLAGGHDHVDALVKIDLDRDRTTFGTVVGSYKGINEGLPVVVPESTLHGSPNIFVDSSGHKRVGAFHKNGLYYVVDPDTMEPVYTGVGGAYFPLGGSSTAFDGEAIFGANPAPGNVYRMNRDSGVLEWVSPTADAAHVAQPPALANGVMYTVDTKGFLDAYDTATGAPVLHRPLALGSGTGTSPVITLGSGVAVAGGSVFAAVGTSFGEWGFVIAFEPTAPVGR